MKRFKKLAGIVLALVMVMALAVPAFAAAGPNGDPSVLEDTTNQTGTITVTNAVENSTSKLYRVLDLTAYNRDTNAYLYKVNSGWAGFFADPATETASGRNYVDIDEKGYVTWKDGADVKEFAKAALAWAKGNNVPEVASKVADATNGTNKQEEEGKLPTYTLTFADLPLGYYLLNSSDGAVCSLDTAAPNVTIENKNPQSTVEKTPVDTSTMVGKTLPFDIKFTAYPTGIQYKVTDTIKKGLSFSDDQFSAMTIAVGGTVLDTNALATAGITTTKTDTGFEVVFPAGYVQGLPEEGVEVVIHYEMTVTAEGVTVVENDATLNYGEGFEIGSTSEPKVPTYCFQLVKLDGNSMKQIEGAEFSVYTAETEGEPIHFVKEDGTAHGEDDSRTEHAYHYRVATPEEIAAGGTTTTIVAGNVIVSGLGNGDYWLEETKAPSGYNAIEGRQKFTIQDADLMAGEAVDGVFDETSGVKVLNKTGSLLPSTGGIGTTIFYIGGGILVVAAVVLLITKRRASVDDE